MDKNSPMNGAYGGIYCAPMWAKFFAAALKDKDAPELRALPVDVQQVGGQDAGHVAVAVGVAVGQRQRQPEPRPDQDHHAEPQPHQDRRRRRRKPTPTKTKPPNADADAHGHAQPPRPSRWSRRRCHRLWAGGASPPPTVTAAGAGGGDTGLGRRPAPRWLDRLLGLRTRDC